MSPVRSELYTIESPSGEKRGPQLLSVWAVSARVIPVSSSSVVRIVSCQVAEYAMRPVLETAGLEAHMPTSEVSCSVEPDATSSRQRFRLPPRSAR